MDKFNFLAGQLKQIVGYAISSAERAHKNLFSDNSDEAVIIGYLNMANSYICSANAIYISNYDLLEHSDIEDLIYQFNVFIKEVLSNIANNHSHQWSDIEYQNLKDKYQCCVLSQ